MKAVRLLIAASLTLLAGVAAAGPALSDELAGASKAAPATRAAAEGGAFSVLTYNVAGLPDLISSGNPAANTPRIGELVNGYDIVHVQEDFNYHAALYATDNHQFATSTSGGVPFGSGLNTMSSYPFQEPGPGQVVEVQRHRLPDAQGLHAGPDPAGRRRVHRLLQPAPERQRRVGRPRRAARQHHPALAVHRGQLGGQRGGRDG